MALLTGASVRAGTHSGYGQSEVRPRGITGFMDQNLYVLGASHRRLIRITNIDNGTGEFASAQFNNPVFSLSEFDSNIYFTIHNALWCVTPPFTATTTATELGDIATGVSIRSLETDGTHLFGYDKNDNKLWRITPAQSSVSAVEFATVEYPAAVTNPNIDGLLYFDGRWYVMDRGTDALYILPETFSQGDTVQATRVGNHTEFGASIGSPLGAAHFDGKAYMVDDDSNGLYRLIETINFGSEMISNQTFQVGAAVDITLPEAEDGTGTYTYAITPALPAGLSFNATSRKITGDPTTAVAETDYTYTATDSGDSKTTTLEFKITVNAVAPIWKSAADRRGSVTAGEASRTFNIASLVDGETSITAVSGVPSWGSFDGTDLILTNIPDTDTVQTITIRFNATNAAGTTPVDFVLTWNPLLVSWVHASRRMQSILGGGSTDVDISALTINADTIEVVSGLERFMNFFGRVLEVRNAPRVTGDTEYTVRFRAKRGGQDWMEADFVLTIAVRVAFAKAEALRKTIPSGATRDIDLTEIVENFEELEVISGLEDWMAFLDGILQITRAPIVTETIDFILRLRARRDMGDWVEAEYLLSLRPNTLLPPNSTQLERDFEAALARREVILFDGANRDPRDNNVPARNVWNPDEVAAPLLPYLANAMSLDVWDDAWTDKVKRQVIKDSYLVHSKKGTVQSIRDLLNSLGFLIAVINEGDANSWANYSVTLNYTVTIAQGQAIIRALEAVAPVRSTLTGLYVQSSSHIYDGSIKYDGSFSYGQIRQLI